MDFELTTDMVNDLRQEIDWQIMSNTPPRGKTMRKIIVNKAQLLETLKKNREKHSADYAEAYDAYVGEAIKKMKVNLKIAKTDKKIVQHLGLVVPQNYTDSYDEIIGMLEMDTTELVELDSKEYSSYVLDKWDWRGQFAASASLYNNKIGA
jgi:hypothetical protein